MKTRLPMVLAAAIIGIGVIAHFSGARKEMTRVDLKSTNAVSSARFRTPRQSNFSHPAPEASEEGEIGPTGMPRLPREKVEEYLRRNHRNAQSLLAAFHALDDTNYLREAATNFPDDPQLQWTVLARNSFPEDRRKWLDAFKASSPDNSLANYWSALEHFRGGQTQSGVEELAAATAKGKFKDYATETQLDGEELAAESGLTGRIPLDVGRSSARADVFPGLAGFKELALTVRELEGQYVAAGDSASVRNLAQMGLALADRLQRGDGAKYLLGQQVGAAVEAIVLQTLDQNANYDFLGGKTPVQRTQELKQWRADIRELQGTLNDALPNLSESEWISYAQRQRTFGELEAMRWLQQRVAAAPDKN